MGDIGAQRGKKTALAGRSQRDPKVHGPVPDIEFGSEKRAQETKACRRIPMVMVDVLEPAIGQGEAGGAVFLAIEIMEHGGGKNEDKNNAHSLFHCHLIIPHPPANVNPCRELTFLLL